MDKHEQLVALILVNNWDNNVLASGLGVSVGSVKSAGVGRYGYSKASRKLTGMYEGEGMGAIVLECYDQVLWSALNAVEGRGALEESTDDIAAMSKSQFALWVAANTGWRLWDRGVRKFKHSDKLTLMAVILHNERLKRREGGTARRLRPDSTMTWPDWLIGKAFGCSARAISRIRSGAGEYAAIRALAEEMGVDAFISRNLTDRAVNRLGHVCDIETGTSVPWLLPAKPEKAG